MASPAGNAVGPLVAKTGDSGAFHQFLPVEILERIAQEVLHSQSRAFSSISALSMVSHQFRHIALRAYFSRLAVHRLSKAGKINDIPNGCSWVRHLSTTMQIVEKKALPVYKMKLGSLELSCESVSTFSLSASILLVLPHLPKSLVSLKITSLPHITQLLLREIAERCMNLKELELSVVERLSTDCCWACFEELSTCVVHSPVCLDPPCDTAGNLATFYARSLRPLGSLQRLSIGVFLSSPAVLEEHIENHFTEGEHCQPTGCTFDDSFSAPHTPATDGQVERPRVHPWRKSAGGGFARQERSAAIGYRPYTPTKCALCWETHGHRTREDELMATMRLAQNLRSLELVRWSSWFNSPKTTLNPSDRAGRNLGEGAALRDAQWAIFEVQRSERRIKVRRRT